MTCFELASPTIAQVIWCGIETSAGGAVFAAILLFALMLYGMYKLGLPFAVQIPIGIGIVFVFAGAGNPGLVAGGLTAFTSMMWIVLIVVGMMVMLAFWRLKQQ